MWATVIYALHWFFVVGSVALSLREFRHVLHPHFLFTCMFAVYLSDFLVRGYDVNTYADLFSQRLDMIPVDNLYLYQLLILGAISTILVISARLRVPHVREHLALVRGNLWLQPRLQHYALALAVALLAAECLKRLSTVGYDPGAVVLQSLGPRGLRDWELGDQASNFAFALLTAFLPLAAILCAYVAIFGRRMARPIAVSGMIFALLLLVTNGSRTPVAIVGAVTLVFAVLRWRNRLVRGVCALIVVATLAVSFSAMIKFRGNGFLAEDQPTANFQLNYAQDDNYYRTLYAFNVADSIDLRWDPAYFFGTIAVNPIPRALWPGKPTIDEVFYGPYKFYWTTISFLGESAALFGVFGGILFAVVYGITLYAVFARATRLLTKPLGTAVYLLVALYVYMCIRSIMSISQFVYLPIAAILAVEIMSRIAARRSRPPAPNTGRRAPPVRPRRMADDRGAATRPVHLDPSAFWKASVHEAVDARRE